MGFFACVEAVTQRNAKIGRIEAGGGIADDHVGY